LDRRTSRGSPGTALPARPGIGLVRCATFLHRSWSCGDPVDDGRRIMPSTTLGPLLRSYCLDVFLCPRFCEGFLKLAREQIQARAGSVVYVVVHGRYQCWLGVAGPADRWADDERRQREHGRKDAQADSRSAPGPDPATRAVPARSVMWCRTCGTIPMTRPMPPTSAFRRARNRTRQLDRAQRSELVPDDEAGGSGKRPPLTACCPIFFVPITTSRYDDTEYPYGVFRQMFLGVDTLGSTLVRYGARRGWVHRNRRRRHPVGERHGPPQPSSAPAVPG
jgi:hypothetical protein